MDALRERLGADRLHRLDAVMEGDLGDLITPLLAAREEEILEEFERSVTVGSPS